MSLIWDYGVFDGFVKNIDMPGIYDLETSANLMINYLFETGNEYNNQPFMLEGIFLWKSESGINVLWRDEKYTFRQLQTIWIINPPFPYIFPIAAS